MEKIRSLYHRMISNKISYNFLVQIVFIIVSLTFVLMFMIHNRILFTTDSIFHWGRIYEIVLDLQHWKFPAFNHYTFPFGGATQIMYPWIFLSPAILLKIIGVSSVHCMIFLSFFILYLGFNIAYYTCLRYSHSKLLGIAFTACYSFSTMNTYYAVFDLDIGYAFALAFAPLVFFGSLYFIKDNKYKMMTIGLILIAYSHIISTIVLVLYLIILFLIKYKSFNKDKIINLLKSTTLFIVLSSVVWLPILFLLLTNNIFKPVTANSYGKLALLLPLKVQNMHIALCSIASISDWCAFLLMILLWKFTNKNKKILFFIAMVVWFLNGNWFKIGILDHTLLAHVFEFPARFCIVSHLILSYLLVFLFMEVLCKHSTLFYKMSGIIGLCITNIIVIVVLMSINFKSPIHLISPNKFALQSKKKIVREVTQHNFNFGNKYMNSGAFRRIAIFYDYSTMSYHNAINHRRQYKNIYKKYTLIPITYYKGLHYKIYYHDKLLKVNKYRNIFYTHKLNNHKIQSFNYRVYM